MTLLVICSLMLLTRTAQTSNSEILLQKEKLLEYNRNVVPKFNESTPISVHLSMYPMNIIRFNEREELLYVNIFLSAYWRDHIIAWDPRLYGNITSTLFKQSQIWLPDLVLRLSKEKMQPIGFDDLNVHVEWTGHVDWEPGINAEIVCSVDTTYFPFDEQTCVVPITTWMHSPSMVRFVKNERSGVNTSVFIENGQWELMELTATTINEHEYYSVVDFMIRLKRRPAYYVTSIIIPVVTVSLLNCFVFLIPRDSGERLSYGMTTFLSYMVLLTLTTDNLPKTSKQRSVFVVYLTCMLALSLFSVVCSVLTNMFPARQSENSARTSDNSAMPSESSAMPSDSSAKPPDSLIKADDHRDIESSAGNKDWATTEYRYPNVTITGDQDTKRASNTECTDTRSAGDLQICYQSETLDECQQSTNGRINTVHDGPDSTRMPRGLQKCLVRLMVFDLGMFVVVSCTTLVITWVALYILVANHTIS